ncbi:hypothetical protein MPER_04084, partial [Moniliophthora perniciosa FA553]
TALPWRKGLQEVMDAQAHETASFGGDNQLGRMFSDPNVLAKLAANPRTSKYLADPSFMQKLQLAKSNPGTLDNLFQDPRMIEAMGVLMGIDMTATTRPEGSTDDIPNVSSESARSPPPEPKPAASSASSSTPASAQETEDVEMEEVDEEEAKAKKEAEALKKTGSEAYKKRDFDAAIDAFQKAWDVWPKDVTFLTNLGAAYFEKGDYDKAIEICEKAVDEGREVQY